jgi:biotin operon repressor
MPKATRKPRASDAAALSANVARTAETAATVLARFKASLLQSGFAAGRDAYRRMTETLLNQRLWALNQKFEAADEQFARIASDAREIYELLISYADLMVKLATLMAPVVPAAVQASERAQKEPRHQILNWLAQQPRPVSGTQIRAALQLSSTVLNAQLRDLEQDGRVVRTAAAGRDLYAAKPSI